MRVRTRINKWMLAQWSLNRKYRTGSPIIIESAEELVLAFGKPNYSLEGLRDCDLPLLTYRAG